MLPGVIVTPIGYAVQLGVPRANRGPLYFSVFLVAPGIYIMIGLNCTWLLNSHAGHYKRAAAVGMNQSLGNSAGVVVSPLLSLPFSSLLLPLLWIDFYSWLDNSNVR